MTKQEFIEKWSIDSDEYQAMEFDLVSVIREANAELRNKEIAEIEERYEIEEPEKKAYQTTAIDVKKYIKSITFGGMKGA